MEEENNTFIPHDSSVKNSTRFGGVFFVLSLLVFVASLVVGGVSYFARTSAASKLVSYEDSLNRSKERFNEGLPIRTIEQFDTRLRAAREILSKHKSFTGLFTLIERITLTNVQFTSLTYVETDNTRKNVVHLIGRAPDYKTIAEESEQFSLDEESRRYITDVVFSNLSVDTKGTGLITFEVVFSVDPEFLSYNRYVTEPLGIINEISSPRDAVPNIKSQ